MKERKLEIGKLYWGCRLDSFDKPVLIAERVVAGISDWEAAGARTVPPAPNPLMF
jgi:hypothetical protein